MPKFQTIKVEEYWKHGYSRGAKPGFRCVVTIQTGERSFDKLDLLLSDADTREVITLAVSKAMAQLVIDPASIVVEGVAGEPEADAEEVPSARLADEFEDMPL